MIEECGRVVAVEPDYAWIETTARSGCGRCEESGGCGQNSIFRMLGDHGRQLRVPTGNLRVDIGDAAVVGVPGGALVKASLLAYLVPLLALLAGASIGHHLSSGYDPAAVFGGLFGMAAGLGLCRVLSSRIAGRSGITPVLLSVGKASLASEPGVSGALS